ncbi:hypothetical protein WJX81_001932 [Elliptochloris bilobata]|uniref:Uncharacterized protein n=1 Tax=Elliptochloris bilobata TaxID=381761 RepID=A0AAW1R1J4_9CHLO
MARLCFELAERRDTDKAEESEHRPQRGAAGLRDLQCVRADGWANSIVWTRDTLGGLCQPQGPGTCDHTPAERTANLLTCLPFFKIGLDTYRNSSTDAGRLYGASVVGVGAGAMAFHATNGEARCWGRRLDYWVIAMSAAALSRIVYPSVPQHTRISLALVPFQPLAVTIANGVSIQAEFARLGIVLPARDGE